MFHKMLSTVAYITVPLMYCAATFGDSGPNFPFSPQPSPAVQSTIFGTLGGKNPTTRNGYDHGFYVLGEFLYWRAEQEGLEYGVKSASPQGQFNSICIGYNSLDDGELLDLDFEWNPGFRIGVGYNMDYDEWDMLSAWTHIHNHAHATAHAAVDPGSISSTFGVFETQTIPAATGKSHWHLDYDVLDLSLGRAYFLTRALSARPFIGVRGLWIKESIHQHFSGQAMSVSDPIPSPITSPHIGPMTITAHNNYYAGGLRMGFAMNWRFTPHWSLLGEGSGSLVYGRFHVDMKHHTDPAFIPFPVDDSHSFNRVRTNLETGIGIQWETNFNKDKCHVYFSLAYQLVQWFDINQLIVYFGVSADALPLLAGIFFPRAGDLGLQGATASLGFDF